MEDYSIGKSNLQDLQDSGAIFGLPIRSLVFGLSPGYSLSVGGLERLKG